MTVSYTHLDVYKRQTLDPEPVFDFKKLLQRLPLGALSVLFLATVSSFE